MQVTCKKWPNWRFDHSNRGKRTTDPWDFRKGGLQSCSGRCGKDINPYTCGKSNRDHRNHTYSPYWDTLAKQFRFPSIFTAASKKMLATRPTACEKRFGINIPALMEIVGLRHWIIYLHVEGSITSFSSFHSKCWLAGDILWKQVGKLYLEKAQNRKLYLPLETTEHQQLRTQD